MAGIVLGIARRQNIEFPGSDSIVGAQRQLERTKLGYEDSNDERVLHSTRRGKEKVLGTTFVSIDIFYLVLIDLVREPHTANTFWHLGRVSVALKSSMHQLDHLYMNE